MRRTLLPIFTLASCVGSLQATTTLSFTNLNAALDIANGNTLQVGVDGGSAGTTGLSVTRSASGDNYLYSVTYTGADYDGDSVNDTLTFGVLVQAWTGSTQTFGTTANNSDSSATIGTSTSQVALGPENTWNPKTSGRFDATESLQFSITSLNVLFSSGSGNAVSTGFKEVQMLEVTGTNHQTIFGQGTGLDGNTYNGDLNKTLSASYGTGDLFITASGGTGSNNRTYGARNVDFGISVTAIPEPSTSALLLGSFGFLVMFRRRCA